MPNGACASADVDSSWAPWPAPILLAVPASSSQSRGGAIKPSARRHRGTAAPISGVRPTSPSRIRSATTSTGGAATGSAPRCRPSSSTPAASSPTTRAGFPLHHRAEFLGDRDLFGELTKAAHDDGIFVMARMDSNRTAEDFFKAHPTGSRGTSSGQPYRAADKYVACINSPYYDDYLPDVLREIVERSHPDGFTDNSWAGLGRESICYCDQLHAQVPGEDRQAAAAEGGLERCRPIASGSCGATRAGSKCGS